MMKLGKKTTKNTKAATKSSKAKGKTKAASRLETDSTSSIEEAKKAVKAFEDARQLYFVEKDNWEVDHEAAAAAWKKVCDLRDDVMRLSKKAKEAVKESGETLGDFKFTQPKSSPGFDSTKLYEKVVDMAKEDPEAAGKLLLLMHQRGVVTGLSLNKDAAIFISQQGEPADLAKILNESYSPGGKLLAPRVSEPSW